MPARFCRSLCLALLFAASPFAFAGSLQQTAGAQCRPSGSSDVAKLDYRDGAATNVADAPGTTAQNATVVCALPPVPPDHLLTRVSVAYYDPDRRWSKCYFFNGFPTTMRTVLVVSSTTNPDIGSATLPVDAREWVPHAVRCTVKPGQMIYGVETEAEPLF